MSSSNANVISARKFSKFLTKSCPEEAGKEVCTPLLDHMKPDLYNDHPWDTDFVAVFDREYI